MRCLRFDLHRKLIGYIDDELSPEAVRRVEAHLMDCNACRARVKHLRDGKRIVRALEPADIPVLPWERLEQAIRRRTVPPPPRPTATKWLLPALGGGATALLLVIAAIVFLAPPYVEFLTERSVDSGKFRPVKIAEIPAHPEPHVVAEGYVAEMRVAEDDGDLVFKLVEDPSRPSPFVVCEIVPPSRLEMPRVGSRVRVFGVRRFDDKTEHQWYEVHPVLEIRAVGEK